MTTKYLTVSALTKYIKQKLETDVHLRDVWLKGEISNFNHHSRGHMYLTIKDDQASIRAVMFARANRHLKFLPEDGMKVYIRGEIGVFEPYGQYQLYIEQMEPDGLGALYLAYEQLKEKLEKQGYFHAKYKRKLPPYPTEIGVITSPTGAAVKDIITTLHRRFPIASITIIPAVVQGKKGARSISQAITRADQHDKYDLLIVGRGGGSIEDLWNFNEEEVAQAIFSSKTPVISAIGHETDHTIADFVADVRAPTPTGAAEIAVPSKTDLLERIFRQKKLIQHILQTKIKHSEEHLKQLTKSYAFRYPEQLIKQKEIELDRLEDQYQKNIKRQVKNKTEAKNHLNERLDLLNPQIKIDEAKKSLQEMKRRFVYNVHSYMDDHRMRLETSIEKLTLLNPLETIRRGFAIPYTKEGEIISSKDQVAKNDHLSVKVKDGKIVCRVIDVKGRKENGTKR